MNRKPIADRLDAIEARLAALEAGNLQNVRLGPNPKQDEELERDRERIVKQIVESAKQAEPIDRSCQVLTDGSPVPEDRSHTELLPSGQQKGYVVLCDAERAKGFVRPYRDAYKHLKCGRITTMGRALAETYARDPLFYSGTFCSHCAGHFPVGEDGEFVWYEMDGSIGPKVGT
jgi:hypothetical protein